MLPLLIALIVFILVGLGLSRWLGSSETTDDPQDTVERSAEQLGQLRWREFAKLVLQAMRGRGYEPVIEPGVPSDGIPTDGSDIVLERDGRQMLLSCKYGSASVVGAQALLGLAKSAKLRGTHGVIVVTPGRFDEEAVRIARQQDIELIDGPSLWPEVRPYVAAPKDAPPPPPPRAMDDSKKRVIAWGSAACAAAIMWFVVGGGTAEETPEPAIAAQPVTATPSPASQAQAQAQAQTAAPQEVTPPSDIPTHPSELDQRRREAAHLISTLFGVQRALWSTQSTLLVHLSAEEADPINEICPLLERYPELAASRIQLQPPAGSSKPVRFKQCRTY